ncbi:conserved hypothetical protein [Streptomyces misionensis JCM 4497]
MGVRPAAVARTGARAEAAGRPQGAERQRVEVPDRNGLAGCARGSAREGQGPRDEASASRQVRTGPRQCPVRGGPPARVAAYRRYRAPVRFLRASGASVPFVHTLPFREAPHDRTPPRRRIRRRARAP